MVWQISAIITCTCGKAPEHRAPIPSKRGVSRVLQWAHSLGTKVVYKIVSKASIIHDISEHNMQVYELCSGVFRHGYALSQRPAFPVNDDQKQNLSMTRVALTAVDFQSSCSVIHKIQPRGSNVLVTFVQHQDLSVDQRPEVHVHMKIWCCCHTCWATAHRYHPTVSSKIKTYYVYQTNFSTTRL